MALRTLSLFSGGAGLDLGIHLATGGASRVVCYVEREAYAAATLVARMEEGSLAKAPIWSDVTSFRAGDWRGAVDLVTGGFPCQDISTAGKGAGLAGARSGLWFEYARILEEIEPDFVFIENVSALRSRGLNVVLGDLASLGFDAEWDCYRASDVGAPHKRERIFILAYRRGVKLRDQPGWRSGSYGPAAPIPGHHGEEVVGDSESSLHRRLHVGHTQSELGSPAADGELGNAHITGLERWGQSQPAGQDQWAPWPPAPEDRDQWDRYLQLRPDAKPSICRGTHGLAEGLEYRTDRLRLCGNGVVPQVAALAFRDLYQRAMT